MASNNPNTPRGPSLHFLDGDTWSHQRPAPPDSRRSRRGPSIQLLTSHHDIKLQKPKATHGMSLHVNTLSAGRCGFSAKRPQSRRWCGRVQLKRQRMPACVPRGSILATRRSIYSTIGCFILGSWQPRSARIRRPYIKYRIEYAVEPEIMQHKAKRTLKRVVLLHVVSGRRHPSRHLRLYVQQ